MTGIDTHQTGASTVGQLRAQAYEITVEYSGIRIFLPLEHRQKTEVLIELLEKAADELEKLTEV